MAIIGTILLSILSGLVAAGIFLLVLSKYRPLIEISPYIAREHEDEKKYFVFKIINKSKRPCINVRVDASLAKQSHVEGGHIFWMKHLSLRSDEVFEISRYNLDDPDADYAWRFATKEDLDDLWCTDSDMVRFHVIATDSLTGFSRGFVREFRLARNSIKDGSHHFGEDLNVS